MLESVEKMYAQCQLQGRKVSFIYLESNPSVVVGFFAIVCEKRKRS